MDNEMLKIMDETGNVIGEATRKEVHEVGYWHQVFQCWIMSREGDTDFLYLQKRSPRKKDYPNLFDITAAGHLLANENIEDGIREVKEEIGIEVDYDALKPLGITRYCVTKENFIDREIAHVFLYEGPFTFNDFVLQEEEVSGIIRCEFGNFYKFWTGELEHLSIEGFEVYDSGHKVYYTDKVTKDAFVQHDLSYFKQWVENK